MNARLGFHALSDVRYRAAKPDTSRLMPDCFRDQLADTAVAVRRHKLTAQWHPLPLLLLTLQPGDQRMAGMRQQVIDVTAQPVCNIVAGHGLKAR